MKKSTRKVISLVISFFIILSLTSSDIVNIMAFCSINTSTSGTNENTTEFAGGTGVESDPYLIETKEHLNNVRKYLGSHYKMINDIVFTEADFSETGDYYNGGNGWIHIGLIYHEPFTGVFDGNGHTITGLYENLTLRIYGIAAGLFGIVCNGIIKNLGMIDSNIIVSHPFGQANAGAIAGFIEFGTVSNCYNTGSVTATTTADSGSHVGGIVGYGGTIINCFNTGNVTAIGTAGAYSVAGGIMGEGSTISNCYNTGKVSAISYGNAKAGGIVGVSDTTVINNCYNTGNISASSSEANSYAGGINGYLLGGTLNNCYNIGNTSSYSYGHDSYNGGITGYPNTYYEYNFNHCYYLNTIDKGIGNGTDSTASITLDEMKQQSMFNGFDFNGVWTMNGNPIYHYPELIENPEYISKIAGDVDGDNSVSPVDVTVLSRYIGSWNGYSFEINLIEANSDLNGDGKVNPLDKTILSRHIANWPNYSHLPLTLS